MVQRLKIAIKRQRKLLVIFLISIFLPSVTLSIFGIIGLRNEKFREVKQIENEQSRLIENFKERLNARFNTIGNRIESLSGHQIIQNKEYRFFSQLFQTQMKDEPMVKQVILVYGNEDPVFPLFQSGLKNEEKNTDDFKFTVSQLQIINQAENYEFKQNNYTRAISLFYQLYRSSKSPAVRIYAMNCTVRNQMKMKAFRDALESCLKINQEYGEMDIYANIPVLLYTQMNTIDCYRQLDEHEKALKTAILFYAEIVNGKRNISEQQFHSFIALATESIDQIMDTNSSLRIIYSDEIAELKKRYQLKAIQWEEIKTLETKVVPQLQDQIKNISTSGSCFRWSRTIEGKNHLLLAEKFDVRNDTVYNGLLAVTLNQDFLENDYLDIEIEDNGLFKNMSVSITDISGRQIKGEPVNDPQRISTMVLFDDNFPPWQVRLDSSGADVDERNTLFSNFFFWTIITLIIILVFGTTLIIRILVKEVELLKIKSDFVSSVSHEFKTPLTSMKALTERIQQGKVTQPEKMKQYVSHISYDIERLIRLVGNILNFSKIEDGQKQFTFERITTSTWLKQVVDNFIRDNHESDIDMQIQISENLPVIYIDKDAMTQALYNLLDNAVRFSPGKKQLSFIAQQKDNMLEIYIKDRGIGIDKEEKDKIFEKFYRGNGAVTYSIKGTGLGLTLVKYSIEAHRGSINVGKEPGWSTVFKVTLPVNK